MPAPRSNGEVRRLPDRDNETLATAIARLEVTVGSMREDVSEIRAAQATFVDRIDHRVSFLEDVRVKALEEREIRQNAIADERERAADAARAAAEQAAAHAEKQTETRMTKRQFWIGTALIVVATILAALISSGHIF